MPHPVCVVGPDKLYYCALQTVQTAVEEARESQERVQRAKEHAC
jgi:hypothetical protein